MAESTGWILAAAGITAANEVIFAPVASGGKIGVDFNWRIVPATAIAALTLAGLEKLSPQLGKGLAILAFITVLMAPMGNAKSPVENVMALLETPRKAVLGK